MPEAWSVPDLIENFDRSAPALAASAMGSVLAGLLSLFSPP
jgi:hypothetical protein